MNLQLRNLTTRDGVFAGRVSGKKGRAGASAGGIGENMTDEELVEMLKQHLKNKKQLQQFLRDQKVKIKTIY